MGISQIKGLRRPRSVHRIAALELYDKTEAQVTKDKDIEQQHVAGDETSGAEWDVSGTWTVDCPYMREQWGKSCEQTECSLVISLEPAEKGSRMWATFDFIALKGIFRFGRPGEVLEACPPEEWEVEEEEEEEVSCLGSKHTFPPDAQRKKMKVIYEDVPSDHESSENSEWDEEEPRPKKAPVPHPPGVCPSTGSPKWDFEWRGCETGESEMQIDFEHQHGHVVFSDGTLTGVFESGLAGQVEFTGKKINAKTSRDPWELKEEWEGYSEENYGAASIARWH